MPEMSPSELLFWLTALLLLYTLTGYPIMLAILTLFTKEKRYASPVDRPKVSFIVAAYNEERNIAAKLANLRGLTYDDDKIEFIIGSDASTDGTDRILDEAARQDGRIRWFRLDQRGGKIAVLKQAVERAGGTILVFTDCSVTTEADIMAKVLSCFGDPKVGLVSSRDVWVNEHDRSPLAQHQYIDYEMTIRQRESRLNSLVSASGSFFAVRRELFRAYGPDEADDFALPLRVYRQGYRVIHCADLVGYVPMVKSSGAELARRTRIIRSGIRTVLVNRPLLNPFRYPIFAWQLWSHKALKWLFPFIVILNILLCIMSWNRSEVYQAVGAAYALLGLLALAGFVIGGRSIWARPFRTANFVLLSMVAVVAAWYQVATGRKPQTWEPTHR